MSWTARSPDAVEGPLFGPDRPMLEGYLAWERATLLNICAGLTAEQLTSRPLLSSNLSLLGLLRHLAKVERTWFRIRAGGEPIEPLFAAELGTDFDFNELDPADAEAAVSVFHDECRLADLAVADVSFDATLEVRGDTMSLRFVYVHMINEYARHNGHADVLREAIDGVTGR